MNEFYKGAYMGIAIMGSLLILMSILFTTNIIPAYQEISRKEMWREAYENGAAVKEISKDDKVIYRWRELHKIGFED